MGSELRAKVDWGVLTDVTPSIESNELTWLVEIGELLGRIISTLLN